MSVVRVRQSPGVADLVERSRQLRRELMQEGCRVDAEAADTTEGMRRCFEEGLHLISIPTAYGGLSDGSVTFQAGALIEIQTNLSAADGSLGQNWGTSQFVTRELFHANLAPSALRQIASDILQRSARFVASNAETGSTQPVTARAVEGGVLVSGIKTFNTDSGGTVGYAAVGCRREGIEGRYQAVIPLNAPGVKLHHDWDNMGQRGTYSQTITYEDVLVPDGWHCRAELSAEAIPLVFLAHASLMLGIALGALDAGIEHLRATRRVLLAQFGSSVEDPLMTRRVGLFSSKLSVAYLALRAVARELEKGGSPERMIELTVEAFRVKAVIVETALEVTQGLFDLTGARTTANKYRFDRFWRNVRTFAVHDPLDLLHVRVGAWELDRQPPAIVGAALGSRVDPRQTGGPTQRPV